MANPARATVVFDLDGTLLDTVDVDEECFVAAMAEALEMDVDPGLGGWDSFRSVTDRGILDELLERARGRPATAAEAARVEAALERRLVGEPRGRFLPIPGAVECLAGLSSSGRWCTAIGTGSFRRSALAKIERSGLRWAGPLRTATETSARVDIFAGAARAAGWSGSDRAVLVGDGSWDVRTARALGWAFVGRATGPAADVLRQDGARSVLDDFCDLPVCERVLLEALG